MPYVYTEMDFGCRNLFLAPSKSDSSASLGEQNRSRSVRSYFKSSEVNMTLQLSESDKSSGYIQDIERTHVV